MPKIQVNTKKIIRAFESANIDALKQQRDSIKSQRRQSGSTDIGILFFIDKLEKWYELAINLIALSKQAEASGNDDTNKTHHIRGVYDTLKQQFDKLEAAIQEIPATQLPESFKDDLMQLVSDKLEEVDEHLEEVEFLQEGLSKSLQVILQSHKYTPMYNKHFKTVLGFLANECNDKTSKPLFTLAECIIEISKIKHQDTLTDNDAAKLADIKADIPILRALHHQFGSDDYKQVFHDLYQNCEKLLSKHRQQSADDKENHAQNPVTRKSGP